MSTSPWRSTSRKSRSRSLWASSTRGTLKSRSTSSQASGARAWIDQVRNRVNPDAVDREAKKRVELIVAGPRSSEFIAALQDAGDFRDDVIVRWQLLNEDAEAPAPFAKAAVYCPEAETTNGALASISSLPFAVFVLRSALSGAPPEARLATTAASSKPVPGAASIYGVSEIRIAELRKHLLPDIARAYHGEEVALAAAVPAFRSVVAAHLTLDCAMNSLKVAAASALADHIPVLGLITGGIASAGDTIAITALQMHMLLRMAAAYGKKADFTRILELIPVVGGGYVWRALAREAVGFIPVAGIPIKAAVAYAGTLVVGQAAAYYYETGRTLSPNAIGALYREASQRAREFASRLTIKRLPQKSAPTVPHGQQKG